MGDDRLAEDVRLPQAASLASARRKVISIAVTTSSQLVQLRDPAASDSETWVTMYGETADINVWFHGGANAPTTLPAATANDWPLPPQTERNYKLGAKETHLAIIGSDVATVKVYVSCD